MPDRTLPEITEAAATGATAVLYQRIRRESGSTLVNYVWRHLATMPGAAEWCWDVTSGNGTASRQDAIMVQRDAALDGFASVGNDLRGRLDQTSHRVLSEYNRNNVINLARTGLLQAAIGGSSSVAEDTAASAWEAEDKVERRPVAGTGSGAEARPPLPPLPDYSVLSEPDRATVDRLSASGPAAGSGVAPSLWRHLSLQPGLLPAIEPLLCPVMTSKGFARAHEGTIRAARSGAVTDLPVLPQSVDRVRLLASVEAFAARIAELTLAGAILARWAGPERISQ